ncbi:hypothetical protein TREES_T100017622 [Tupaia chinensis]|uniref:Uncharacterized protein n=1 Tax=Tupaia chinensis TaxID=246437 RepID=L9L4A2_TUPCH|nr:hypothetical protein TREES_T100017622 [Tupaia chinensis]
MCAVVQQAEATGGRCVSTRVAEPSKVGSLRLVCDSSSRAVEVSTGCGCASTLAAVWLLDQVDEQF